MTAAPTACLLLSTAALEGVFSPSDRTRLESLLDVVAVHTDAEEARTDPRLRAVEVLVAGWGTPPLTGPLLDAMPALRLVLYSAGSIRGIATDDLWQRDIAVVSAAEANNEPVADFVEATIVLALKGEHHAVAQVREDPHAMPGQVGLGIYDRQVGLVGFGSIARKVAQRLRRFGHDLSVWDPYLDADDAAAQGVRLATSLEDLFAENDAVSIHAPWRPGVNERMITGAHLSAMRQGAVLINTARGALVAEDEMAQVLRDRPDLYAVLDVTYPEPAAPDSPLRTLPNVKLTGHIAGSLGHEQRLLGRLVLAELERWLAGEPLQHQVTREESVRRA